MWKKFFPEGREGRRLAYSDYPVLPFYHHDGFSPRGRRWLTIGFFCISFLFGFWFAILPDHSKGMLTIPLAVMAAMILWVGRRHGSWPTFSFAISSRWFSGPITLQYSCPACRLLKYGAFSCCWPCLRC